MIHHRINHPFPKISNLLVHFAPITWFLLPSIPDIIFLIFCKDIPIMINGMLDNLFFLMKFIFWFWKFHKVILSKNCIRLFHNTFINNRIIPLKIIQTNKVIDLIHNSIFLFSIIHSINLFL